ncbi:phosphoribosyltransferase [Marinobacterium nitratireducens]|uniref:Phosphoribosyltransferase n=1 Tax=Marinobacterium nitratireducens TaxID=518897 RepID=A0A917ZR73_9GAMM|nr:ComF family protein [Marinobacterium nitratireducens]GGO88927.1 phosphoribosyltransferase [Marinobacterium nitratireducens]
MELSTKVFSRENCSIFFNQHCFLCRLQSAQRAGLCSGCLRDLPRIAPACRRCALPLTGVESLVCGRCLKKPPPFERCITAFAYAFPINQLLPRIKYDSRPENLGWLADAMALELGEAPRPEILVPVPLAPARLRRRGYNQAELLARRLGRRLDIAVDRQSLGKPRDTPHQMTLAGAERRRNLKGAFCWNGPAYRHLALVDDVMTTGTTVSEIANLLLRQGVARIDVWVLARTPAPGD